MSGTYDLEQLFKARGAERYYFAAPLNFVPDLDGQLLDLLRRRFFVLTHGGGRWEEPEQSWRMAGVLGAKGVPNRVDTWGPEWDHDWPTWREMLPRYLAELAPDPG
jgi:esterase/lipase superfamily enzyme